MNLKFPFRVLTASVLGGLYLHQVFQASNKSPFRTFLESSVPPGLLILFLTVLLYRENTWDGSMFQYGGKNKKGNEPLRKEEVQEDLNPLNKGEMDGDPAKNPESTNQTDVPSQLDAHGSEKPSTDEESQLSHSPPPLTIPEDQPSTPAKGLSTDVQQTENSNDESAWVNIPTRTRAYKRRLPRNIIWKKDIKKTLRREGMRSDSERHGARRGRAEWVDRFDDDDERPRRSEHTSREEPSEDALRRARWDLGV